MYDIFGNNLRLGIHGEKIYFSEGASLYSGIALNATIVALSPNAIGIFLLERQKPFFIDPQTYAFSCNPIHIMKKETGEIKKSIQNLREEYEGPVQNKIPVTSEDFKDEKTKKNFCKKVLAFQEEFIIKSLEEDKKYIEESDVPGEESFYSLLKPDFIIAPYFNLDIDTWEEYINLNKDFAKISMNLAKNKNIYCEIVLERSLLHQNDIIDKILESYSNLNCQGFLIWISDFPEHRTASDEIKEVKKIVENLSQGEKKVINLYGGYLSCLFAYSGLTSFCHGPGYGEDRDIVPVGGGFPYPKYYFPPLHLRIRTDIIEWYLKETKPSAKKFFKEICDCPICKNVIKDNVSNFYKFGEMHHSIRKDGIPYSYPTEKAKYLNNSHFLYARQKEIQDINEKRKEEILIDLQISTIKYLPKLGKHCSHLKNWHDAFSLPKKPQV